MVLIRESAKPEKEEKAGKPESKKKHMFKVFPMIFMKYTKIRPISTIYTLSNCKLVLSLFPFFRPTATIYLVQVHSWPGSILYIYKKDTVYIYM